MDHCICWTHQATGLDICVPLRGQHLTLSSFLAGISAILRETSDQVTKYRYQNQSRKKPLAISKRLRRSGLRSIPHHVPARSSQIITLRTLAWKVPTPRAILMARHSTSYLHTSTLLIKILLCRSSQLRRCSNTLTLIRTFSFA